MVVQQITAMIHIKAEKNILLAEIVMPAIRSIDCAIRIKN